LQHEFPVPHPSQIKASLQERALAGSFVYMTDKLVVLREHTYNLNLLI
jgi:hypothetical protein